MSYTCLHYHIVFSTKERRSFLTRDLIHRMRKYIGGIVRELGGSFKEADGGEDHLHLAARLPATLAISDILRTIKTNSSKWIHQTFEDLQAFGWQDGYAAFTVSRSAMPDVVRYIQGQEEHHKRLTFQEELKVLLRKHGIEFDERFLGS